MKHFLFSLFLACVTFMSAQDINQFDTNGKRHGVWEKTFENSKIPRYQGQFNHGKPVGVFKFYEAIGDKPVLIAKREFNKSNNLALVTFYTSKGAVISKGKMDNKTYVGEWLYYHKDSKQVMSQEFYNDKGELNGKKKVYYLSGKIAEESNYVNDKLEGKSVSYSEKGKVLRQESYKNDEFHGLFKNYDNAGNLISEGHYANDRKTGVWKFYQNGKLVETKDLSKKPKRKRKFKKKK